MLTFVKIHHVMIFLEIFSPWQRTKKQPVEIKPNYFHHILNYQVPIFSQGKHSKTGCFVKPFMMFPHYYSHNTEHSIFGDYSQIKCIRKENKFHCHSVMFSITNTLANLVQRIKRRKTKAMHCKLTSLVFSSCLHHQIASFLDCFVFSFCLLEVS